MDKLKHSQNPKTRRLPALVRDFLDGGGLSFTAQQWAKHSGQNQEDTDFQCSQLLQKGLVDRDIRGEVITYTFRVTQTASSDQEPEDEDADGSSHSEEASESPPISEKLMSWIENSEVSDYGYRKKVAAYFRELIAAGSLTFTSKDLIEQTACPRRRQNPFAITWCADRPSSIPIRISDPPRSTLRQRNRYRKTSSQIDRRAIQFRWMLTIR